jgi:hypothetical protein
MRFEDLVEDHIRLVPWCIGCHAQDGRNSSDSSLENQDYGRRDPPR